jgi:hypothetical protein
MKINRTSLFRKQLQKRLSMGAMILVGCLFILGGCQSEPVPSTPASFEDLCQLRQDQLVEMDILQLSQWIEDKYGVSPIYSETGDVRVYVWGAFDEPDSFFGNAYVRDGNVIRIVLYNVQGAPNFGEVVSGLGEPLSVYQYAQQYEKVLYSVGLDYPTIGVSVYASELVSRQSLLSHGKLYVEFRGDMLVDLVECYAPGATMEEVLNRDDLDGSVSIENQLHNRLPWPGFGVAVPLSIP